MAERERATGAQMAIAIFPALEGGSAEDFSIRLAEKWRIGQKGLDNGVILVLFVKERKLRFEVGYGLESAIPDLAASQIIREVVAPSFRAGRYAAGLEGAVNAVYARVPAGGSAPAKSRPSRSLPRGTIGLVVFGAILAIIALILGSEAYRSRGFVGRRGYTASRHGWSGPVILPGGWGGGGGSSGSSGGGGDGGFSGGGGGFGGGGASGEW